MEAKQYLGQLKKLELLINNKLIEKKQWMDVALNITGNMDGERVQSSGARSKMAEAVEKCVAVEEEIDSLVDELIDKKKEIIATIELLPKPIEYDMLHRLYIQKQTLQEVADHYHKEYGWATTTNGRAIQSLQKILDGVTDIKDGHKRRK